MLIFDQLRKNDAPLRNLALAVTAGLLLLFIGLWYVQVIRSKRYVETEKDQSYRTVRIPAVRGKILDRNGLPLAENRASYNISLYLDELRKQFQQEYKLEISRLQGDSKVPLRLTKKQRESFELHSRFQVASRAVQPLNSVLNEPIAIDERQFHRHYEIQRVLPFPVVQNLNPMQIAKFEEQPFNASGVDLEMQPTRLYPSGPIAAHLLGQLTRDNSSMTNEDAFFNFRLQDFRGVLGLEAAFDQELRGRAGVKSVKVNRLGYRQAENIWTPSEPGKNLVLTLDLPLQLAAENALRNSPAGTNTRGAVVVLDARNGDVLVMASGPGYDPNQFVRGVTREEMQRLNEPKLTPQINRATQGFYQPGSIFKIVTAMAALEAGVLNPSEIFSNLEDPQRPGYGHYMLGRRKIKDTAPPGEYDFKRAFVKSSNSYFVEYGRRAGLEKILDMGNRLFLGERCDLPLPGQDGRGRFPTLEEIREARKRGEIWTEGDTANLCFGQGPVSVTPMQMAIMTAAVANGGKVFWPRLVQRIEPQEKLFNDEEIVTFPSRIRGQLGVSQKTLEIVRDAMISDVEMGPPERGTAFDAFHENDHRTPLLQNLRVGGKTGTAQVEQGGRVVDHITWFVSYTSPENPRDVVVVMVESGGSGGGTCAPIAVKVYREIYKRENPASPSRPKNQFAQLPLP